MAIKIYKPTTPGRRRSSVEVLDKEMVKKAKPVKSLITIKKKKGGRNATGKITVRHIGGGEKKYIRKVDFKRDKFEVEGRVESLQYDPNRSAYIALVIYKDGERRYVLAPDKIKVDDTILSSKKKISIKKGNRMPLKYIPWGLMVYNIEMIPGKGGQIARSAGQSVKLMGIEGKYAQLKMPSSEIRLVPKEGLATIGQVSNPEHSLTKIGKAGRKRHMGVKPTVRGKVMNPVDHPHGGGEGRNPIGMKHPKTPWGKIAIGGKTRKKQKTSDKLILKRRKNKRKK